MLASILKYTQSSKQQNNETNLTEIQFQFSKHLHLTTYDGPQFQKNILKISNYSTKLNSFLFVFQIAVDCQKDGLGTGLSQECQGPSASPPTPASQASNTRENVSRRSNTQTCSSFKARLKVTSINCCSVIEFLFGSLHKSFDPYKKFVPDSVYHISTVLIHC